LTQALSLSKMAKRALAEDQGSALLQKRIAELEETNARLEESNAEMRLTGRRSREAVTALRCELDLGIQDYELLGAGNTHLLNERVEGR
jgi:hypothetical protein